MKVFFDMEFTELSQAARPISLGMVSDYGDTFYAEFVGYGEVSDWVRENVVAHLRLPDLTNGQSGWTRYSGYAEPIVSFEVKGETARVRIVIEQWLEQVLSKHAAYGDDRNRRPEAVPLIEMCGDVLAYDWVLFCQLWGGGAECLPRPIYYIPFDLATRLNEHGYDPDVDRRKFSGLISAHKHNALDDATVIKRCWERC